MNIDSPAEEFDLDPVGGDEGPVTKGEQPAEVGTTPEEILNNKVLLVI